MTLLSATSVFPVISGGSMFARMGRPRINPLPDQMPNRIREIRERTGISLAELGRRTGFKPQTLQRYEVEDRGIPIAKLLRIARALSVGLTDILNPGDLRAKVSASEPLSDAPLDAQIEDKAMELALLIADAAGPLPSSARARLIRKVLAFASDERGRLSQEAAKEPAPSA